MLNYYFILNTCKCSKFSLYYYTMSMSIFNYLLCNSDILFE